MVRHRVREVRLEKGLSQSALASALDLADRTSISQLERKVSEPRYSTLEKIACALGCDVSELLPQR